MTHVETRAPSSTPAIVIACVAMFTDMLVYGLAIPILPLLPTVVAAGPAAAGVLFASYAVAMLAATPVTGWLVDRFGPRVPLLCGMLGLAAATALFALSEQYWVLTFARVVQGASGAMGWVAGLSLVATVTTPANRGRAMGFAMSMTSVGLLVGPPLAGILVEHFTVQTPFLVASGLAVLGALGWLTVRGSGRGAGEQGGPRGVLRVRGIWPVLGAVLLSAGTVAAIEPILPLHLTTGFGMSAMMVGVLFAVLVAASAVLSPVAGGLVGRVDARALAGLGVVSAAAGMALIGVAAQSWQVWVGMVLLGAGEGCLLAPTTTLVAELGMAATPPTLGGAYALYFLAFGSGLMLGPLLAGAGTGWFGFGATLVGLAILTVAVGGLTLLRLPPGLRTP
ncbi:MFS transporter [Pseudonocardia spinosispora]|uniref:MFS transporter n=1 Tax=Pseudonocardia spinosispora TaxID=103441 RepID=UPI00041F3193|nr:MFS transporter [Pseudonocardia spinosispora]